MHALIEKALTLGVRVTQYAVVAYMLAFKKYFQELWLEMQRKCSERVNNETAKGMVGRNGYNNLNG